MYSGNPPPPIYVSLKLKVCVGVLIPDKWDGSRVFQKKAKDLWKLITMLPMQRKSRS